SIPSRALAIAISRALTRPSLSRRARRRSSSEPISSRIDNADIVGPPPQTTTSATRKSFSMQLSWRVSLNSGRYYTRMMDSPSTLRQKAAQSFKNAVSSTNAAEAEKLRELGRQLELWAGDVEEMLTKAPCAANRQCKSTSS